MWHVSQVAVGRREKLSVFGDDYDTVDGTGVRDYIHVVDLALGHVAAIRKVVECDNLGTEAYNLGTGNGTSVLEVVKAFETASGKPVPFVVAARRPGDIATCFADASKAHKELGWKAERTMTQMCADGWRWQKNNPLGYRSEGQADEPASAKYSKCTHKMSYFIIYFNFNNINIQQQDQPRSRGFRPPAQTRPCFSTIYPIPAGKSLQCDQRCETL